MDIKNKYIKVTNSDGSIAVSDYFENAVIETGQTIESGNIDDISTTGLEELPNEGWIEKKLYSYNNDVVYCRQPHNRTIYDPKNTPALFSFFREEIGDLQWIKGEQVEIGWMRIYNDVKYEVIQSHQTQSDWTPNIANTLWKVYEETGSDIPVWKQPTGAHDAYQIGDQVYYPTINDAVYESKINANTTNPIGDVPYNRYWEPL